MLALIPTRGELAAFMQACLVLGWTMENVSLGRLPVVRFPGLDLTVTRGGLGKAEFAVHTQHLIDAARWDLVVCAGAGGALVDHLAVGAVVVATETVEHDIRNRFGPPLLPRFAGSAAHLEACRRLTQPAWGFPVHFGPIASGDEDVVDVERRQAIQAQTGALVVAWEGAGGARACAFSQLSYLEIRGVSDGANQAAPQDYEFNQDQVMQHVAHLVMRLALALKAAPPADAPAGV